ncbi:MAG: hypothetical protein L3K14_07105 [Thermoplasmata archaeon]|nr:hypothetical protein [Thermoplasmata archaeon]
MKVWGKNERSWRRKNKRAVSPIIATILLVAITVVLAAVLYILIQQYTKGTGGGAPLGSALAFGNPADATWGTISGYNFTVESASSTLTIGSVIFQVKSPTGAITTTGITISIVNVQGKVEGIYTPATATWGGFTSVCGPAFATACGTTTVITSQNLLSLQITPASSLIGYSLVALGQGGFQGSVPVAVT